jgi:hypothetical protein
MNTKTSETPSASPTPKSGELPSGVPPLTPDPEKLAAALGGAPIPMQIKSADPAEAPREPKQREANPIQTATPLETSAPSKERQPEPITSGVTLSGRELRSRVVDVIAPPQPAAPVIPLDATFAPPRENLILRQQVADLRSPLLQVINSIQQATKLCPPLIEAIRPSADTAQTTEHFDLAKAEKFLAAVQAAVADITAA